MNLGTLDGLIIVLIVLVAMYWLIDYFRDKIEKCPIESISVESGNN